MKLFLFENLENKSDSDIDIIKKQLLFILNSINHNELNGFGLRELSSESIKTLIKIEEPRVEILNCNLEGKILYLSFKFKNEIYDLREVISWT